jgi:signal transduction histidine kinase
MAGVFYLSLVQILKRHETTELKELAGQWMSYLSEEGFSESEKKREPFFSKGHEEHGEDNDSDEKRKPNEFLYSDRFFLLFDQQGTLIAHSLTDAKMAEWLQAELARWPDEDLHEVKRLFRQPENEEEQVYALMALPLSGEHLSREHEHEHDHEYVSQFSLQGRLFVGNEVTDYWFFIQRMRNMLLILALGLLFVAAIIGFLFSERAMIPILNAYRKQQSFLADASHELRTPISILQSSVEILDEIKPQIPDFHQRVLDDMADEVARMGRMVQDLLVLARSDAGQLELLKETFDFAETCRSVTERMNNIARKKGVQLTCHTPEQPVWMHGDRERLSQLLYILLDNAIKYTPEGGRVNVTLSHANGGLECVVQDTGIGIPDTDLPHIFERFYRVDKDRSRKLGGTGIGLSIADWIVKAHGGRIKVTSQVGKGTAFHIRLPSNRR